MTKPTLALSALAGAALLAGAAMAHHGWSWAEADQIDLTGTITAISFAPPHPTLELETADGGCLQQVRLVFLDPAQPALE